MKGFFIILGSIALIADVITIGQFVLSGTLFEFWSAPWIASVGFVILLFALGALFFAMAEQEQITKSIFTLLGGGYLLLAILVYAPTVVKPKPRSATVSNYFGSLVLLAIVCAIGIGTCSIIDPELLLLPSFAFGFVNLGCILLMLYKYVFMRIDFDGGPFMGEIFVVIIGAGLFLGLYAGADG